MPWTCTCSSPCLIPLFYDLGPLSSRDLCSNLASGIVNLCPCNVQFGKSVEIIQWYGLSIGIYMHCTVPMYVNNEPVGCAVVLLYMYNVHLHELGSGTFTVHQCTSMYTCTCVLHKLSFLFPACLFHFFGPRD